MESRNKTVLSSLVQFEQSKQKLVSAYYVEVDVAVFFKRKVKRHVVFNKESLSLALYPVSLDADEIKSENNSFSSHQVRLAESKSISFFYHQSFPPSNCSRNKIEKVRLLVNRG